MVFVKASKHIEASITVSIVASVKNSVAVVLAKLLPIQSSELCNIVSTGFRFFVFDH